MTGEPFDPEEFIMKSVRDLQRRVGGERAVAACSGGVDSTTAAFLAHTALGEDLIPVFLDDGLRREGEPEFVVDLLTKLTGSCRYVGGAESFFQGLRDKKDPEEKRVAFREIFYRKMGEIVREERAEFLVQGTIAADIVETTGGIKTQHNVLDQIGIDTKEYGFQLLEPLKDLYKPRVRIVARELGLPEEVSERMPFPGPALMIRVLGEVTPEKIDIVRKATSIVEEETKGLNAFQSLAALLGDRATGVKNGERIYGDIITVRIVESEDAITATVLEVPYHILSKISRRITSEIPSVSRCLFDITDKPPATIEFE